jgi:hypothetical protein
MIANKVPSNPNTGPHMNPARRPIRFIRIDAGKVEVNVPKNRQPIGRVAHILFSTSANPINAEVAIISELPESISA